MILLYFSFLFGFQIFKCQMCELIFRMPNVYVNFWNVLFIASFKKYFEKTDSEQASLRNGYNEILRKIYER